MRALSVGLIVALIGAAAIGQDKKTATVKITVPDRGHADTVVKVDGNEVKGTGTSRTFTTAAIEPGKELKLKVEALIEPNNYTKITRTREVTVKAGDEVKLDLTAKNEKEDKIVVRWVPTPDDIVEEMMKLGKVGKDDVVYEPGPGDGRMLIAAVKKGAKKGVGIELDPKKAEESKENVKKAKLEDKITIIEGDALKDRDYSEATVVLLYMGNEFNALLRPILEKQLKPGTRIVSHRFTFGDWAPDKSITVTGLDGDEYKLHVWTVKAKK